MGARQKDILDLTKDIQKSSLISYLEQSPIKSQTNSGSPGGWIKQTHVRRKDYQHSYLGMSSTSTLRGNSQSSLTGLLWAACCAVVLRTVWQGTAKCLSKPLTSERQANWRGSFLSLLTSLWTPVTNRGSWETHLAHVGSTIRVSPSSQLSENVILFLWVLLHKTHLRSLCCIVIRNERKRW